MRRIILASGASLALVVPSVALAQAPTARHVRQYTRLYHRVADRFGARAPGRNIMRDGLAHGALTDRAVVRSIATLERMLYVAPVSLASDTAYSTSTESAATPAYSSATSGGGYTIPASIVQCESGGNYSALNPSSGAGGAYQILPSTWAAYGGQGLPQDASPAEQGAIAAKIWANQGPGAWVC